MGHLRRHRCGESKVFLSKSLVNINSKEKAQNSNYSKVSCYSFGLTHVNSLLQESSCRKRAISTPSLRLSISKFVTIHTLPSVPPFFPSATDSVVTFPYLLCRNLSLRRSTRREKRLRENGGLNEGCTVMPVLNCQTFCVRLVHEDRSMDRVG